MNISTSFCGNWGTGEADQKKAGNVAVQHLATQSMLCGMCQSVSRTKTKIKLTCKCELLPSKTQHSLHNARTSSAGLGHRDTNTHQPTTAKSITVKKRAKINSFFLTM